MNHYFTSDPSRKPNRKSIDFRFLGISETFISDDGVFSKETLDFGSRVLLETVIGRDLRGDILDLGCGWGVIGIAVARKWPETRVTLADVNTRALALSRENAKRNRAEVVCAESDGMAALMDRSFDAVITNPPIRAGKQVIYRMFADAAARLKPGGALYLVIRKQQGAESCIRYLQTLFANVEKLDKSGGFWVLKGSGEIIG